MEIEPAENVAKYFNNHGKIPIDNSARKELIRLAYPEGRIKGVEIESLPREQVYRICQTLEQTAYRTIENYELEILQELNERETFEKATKSLDKMVAKEQEQLRTLRDFDEKYL
jgi:hypothetical protein